MTADEGERSTDSLIDGQSATGNTRRFLKDSCLAPAAP